jgi:ParB-like chromosome segregation protein Spo0J
MARLDTIVNKASSYTVSQDKFSLFLLDPKFNVRELEEYDIPDTRNALLAADKREGYAKINVPVIVKRIQVDDEDRLLLIDGNRRITAALELAEEGVQFPDGIKIDLFKVDDSADEEEEMVWLMLTTGMGSKPISQLSRSKAIDRIRKCREEKGLEFDISVVAKRLQVSAQHVRDILKYLDAPEEIKAAVENGKVSMSGAIEVVKEHGYQGAVELVTEAIEHNPEKGKVTKRDLDQVKTPKGPLGNDDREVMVETLMRFGAWDQLSDKDLRKAYKVVGR